MAKNTQPKSSGVVEDPLVASLVPDPSQGPPNTTVLAGYLGRGTEEGVWRLYLTPELDEFVEILEDTILHRQSLPDGRNTQIWVHNDLEVRYVRSEVERIPASQLGRPHPRTLPASPRIRPTGSPTAADVLPFALTTAHHAPAQLWGTPGYYPNKMASDKKRRDDLPGKSPWRDYPGDLDPLTVQYDQLLTDYLDLVAAYEQLRQSRG
jgi:hypothetical protein